MVLEPVYWVEKERTENESRGDQEEEETGEKKRKLRSPQMKKGTSNSVK